MFMMTMMSMASLEEVDCTNNTHLISFRLEAAADRCYMYVVDSSFVEVVMVY